MPKYLLRSVVAVVVLGVSAAFSYWLLMRSLEPVSIVGEIRYIRIERGETIGDALKRAEKIGVLRSASGAQIYARLFGGRAEVLEGTYEINSAMNGMEIAQRLLSKQPIKQYVLIREGLWMSRVADLLAEKNVCDRETAMQAFMTPKQFESAAGFPLPADSLEGYLFPDTYDLPPLFGANRSVEKMLHAFRTKVYEPLGKPPAGKLHEWVIIGSMIELESQKDDERARIAGVIYNRLNSGMKLQIDATVAYAKGQMGRLLYKDYEIDHPYNTYRIPGLPPGPICSPGFASIRAAANPEKHDYLFYVAMPDGSHLFSKTYKEHLANIEISRKAFKGGASEKGR